jgi:hypothetical protein
MNKDVNVGRQSAPGPGKPDARPRRWPKIVVVLVLVCAAGGAAGYYYKFGTLKWSEPYQMALDKLKTDQHLVAEIGTPIKDASCFPSGEINNDPNNGTARLFFDVAGPKAKAHVQVDARRIGGKWGLSQLAATADGGSRIPINLGSEGGLEEAPRWSP